MLLDDDRYQREYVKLTELCQQFIDTWKTAQSFKDNDLRQQSFQLLQLLTGMIMGQCANIYNLSPPGGLLHPSEMFRKE